MRLNFYIFFFLVVSTITYAQKNDVITWIDSNAIQLETNNSEKYINLTSDYLNPFFSEAEIYGFGEATHYNKEFFEAKTAFFKYLVLHQNVRVFILEESFGACYSVNEYIKGNNRNIKELVQNFRQSIWETEEMLELIQWIKTYNESKPLHQQISFYGNDCQFNYELISILKNQLIKNNIKLTKEEINLLEIYASNYNDYFNKDKSGTIYVKLNDLKLFLSKLKENTTIDEESKLTINALNYFAEFLNKQTQETRDFYMAESVENIYNCTKKKVFIWAHNDHINKNVVHATQTPSMGNLLYKKFKNKYYAMGFEFSVGELLSYNIEKNVSENILLDKPIKNTNYEFLFSTNHDAFFMDFNTANKDASMRKFLSQKRNSVMIGGQGLVLKYLKYNYIHEKYITLFDGLVYIKKISRSIPLKY